MATSPALPDFDPNIHRSSCCFDRMIQCEGKDGHDYYECMKCGDACDPVTEPQPKPEKQKRKKAAGTVRPCCGSRGNRHKSDCPGKGKPETEAAAPATEVTFSCESCTHNFIHDPDKGKAECPKCGSDICWPQ